jgi:alpha-D-ribose 1-methylphosphonate 5-triphosphate synthase subunit PhnI
MSNLKKKDGFLVSLRYSAVSGHGRVALFLNLCAVSDVKLVSFLWLLCHGIQVGLLLNV